MICSRIEFSGHAVRRMFERQIAEDAVLSAIRGGKVIAEYPDDEPYPSVLVLGEVAGRSLHVVIGSNPRASLAA